VRLIALALVLIALANCTPDRDSPAPEGQVPVGTAETTPNSGTSGPTTASSTMRSIRAPRRGPATP
jgi:hypothetical protein